jgi:hypothetical protein
MRGEIQQGLLFVGHRVFSHSFVVIFAFSGRTWFAYNITLLLSYFSLTRNFTIKIPTSREGTTSFSPKTLSIKGDLEMKG